MSTESTQQNRSRVQIETVYPASTGIGIPDFPGLRCVVAFYYQQNKQTWNLCTVLVGLLGRDKIKQAGMHSRVFQGPQVLCNPRNKPFVCHLWCTLQHWPMSHKPPRCNVSQGQTQTQEARALPALPCFSAACALVCLLKTKICNN